MNRKTSTLLSSIGIFIMALSLIIMRYTELPDALLGGIMGVGLGLLLVSLLKGRVLHATIPVKERRNSARKR